MDALLYCIIQQCWWLRIILFAIPPHPKTWQNPPMHQIVLLSLLPPLLFMTAWLWHQRWVATAAPPPGQGFGVSLLSVGAGSTEERSSSASL